jgi:hypothetical protein
MALEYFKYITTYGNTIVDRSNTSFAPVPPYAELYINYFIPEIQPLYLYRVTGSTIVPNTTENINAYLSATELPPTSSGNVTYGEFTGATIALNSAKVNRSGDTMTGTLRITGALSATQKISGSTAYGSTCVYSPITCGTTCVISPLVCGSTKVQSPIITGSTCSIAPITIGTTCVCSPIICASSCVRSPIISGSTAVCGAIVCGVTCVTSSISCATTRMQSPIITGSTCVTSPRILGTTCVSAPITCGTSCVQTALLCSTGQVKGTIITGSTCSTSPIICGTTCVISPIVLGSTCVCSPTICTSTCLCSTGTARFTGAVTDASTLNVSGATRIAGALTALSTLNVSGNTTLSATARSVTPATTDCSTCIATTAYMRNYLNTLSGGSTNYYYTECATICCTTLGTCVKYLGWTGTSLSAGRYQVDVTEQVGQASANKGVLGKITFDGVEQGSIFELQMNVTNFTFANTLSRDVTWSAGTHTVNTYYWAAAGTACASFASVRIKKLY